MHRTKPLCYLSKKKYTNTQSSSRKLKELLSKSSENPEKCSVHVSSLIQVLEEENIGQDSFNLGAAHDLTLLTIFSLEILGHHCCKTQCKFLSQSTLATSDPFRRCQSNEHEEILSSCIVLFLDSWLHCSKRKQRGSGRLLPMGWLVATLADLWGPPNVFYQTLPAGRGHR